MDRRDFIETAVMTAGGILLSSAGFKLNAKNNRKMKIVLLTGSPRRAGNTNHLADQFTKGAEEAGHEVFRFDAAARQPLPFFIPNFS